jgi:DNA polymerase elongation subunit (family B)
MASTISKAPFLSKPEPTKSTTGNLGLSANCFLDASFFEADAGWNDFISIPFVYINTKDKKALQGEKIETPNFIVENNLKIDYSFYITNQIMKPIQQLFALVLEDIWREENKTLKIRQFKKECSVLRKGNDDESYHKKLETLKNKEVKTLLFDDYLRVTNNEKEGMKSLKGYFK